MGRYRKIDTRTWNDKKFNELSDYGKLIFFLLLTHPHLTPIGAMRASLPSLASDLHWPLEKIEKAFQESFLKNMIRYDESSSFIWLPNFLKYNQPESPNVVKSWEYYLDDLPECALKELLISHIKSYVKSLSESFHKVLPQAFGKAMPNHEHEQEHEHEHKKILMSGEPDVNTLKDFVSNKKDTKNLKSEAIEILNFLNQKTGRAYRPVDTNLKMIMARLKSGATVIDCRQVIAKKTREWKSDAKMCEYLRPATLFNASKFEQYIGELVLPKDEADEQS